MKRALPFLIIALVALATVGIATAVYRAKIAPSPAPVASVATPGSASSPATAASSHSAAKNAPNYVERRDDDDDVHARGASNSPVTLEIYGDFQCPSCAVTSAAIGELEKQYEGRLRVVFHQFPLAMHNHAMEAALAAEAAGMQGKFWQMHDLIYRYQSVWSKFSDPDRFFSAYAESLGLDVARFADDAKNPATRALVIADGDTGTKRGVKNTPTLFINGREARNTFTKDKIQEALDLALAEKKGP